MVGETQKKNRQVIRLSITKLDKTDKKYLSIQPCDMKDLKINDIFFMLEPDYSLVIDEKDSFLFMNESIPRAHKDTYIVKCRGIK